MDEMRRTFVTILFTGTVRFSLTNFMIRIHRIVSADLASAGAFAVDRSANQILYAEVFGVANICHFFT